MTTAFSARGRIRLRRRSYNMKFYIYVLKSEIHGIRYIGSGENVEERLRRHNKGDYKFTKGHRPWKIIYQEEYNSRGEAVKREKFLKTGQGRKFLDSILIF